MITGAGRPLYKSETFWVVLLTAGWPLAAILAGDVLPALAAWLGGAGGR